MDYRGHTLTLLDVTCLALAIPTHVGYGIFTRIACGKVRRFSDDAEGVISLQTSLGDRWGLSLADAGVSDSRLIGRGEHESLSSRQPEGLVAKSLIFTAGQQEGGWNDLELGWNSTVFAVLVCLDLYTCYDILLGVETGLFTMTSRIVQEIKYIASFVGCVLLVIRLDAWINHRSDIAPLFHVRGLLEAMTMMLTFDDTPYFLYKVGNQMAGEFVLGETILKLVIGGVHIAAIIVELPDTLTAIEQPA